MFYYAELNSGNVCVGVKMVAGVMDYSNHVAIDSVDGDLVNRKYENGEWSAEKYVPDHSQIELDRMEKLEASQAEQDNLLMDIMMGRL